MVEGSEFTSSKFLGAKISTFKAITKLPRTLEGFEDEVTPKGLIKSKSRDNQKDQARSRRLRSESVMSNRL